MIETPRLLLLPLRYEEMHAYLYQPETLPKALNLTGDLPPEHPELRNLFESTLSRLKAASDNFIYLTQWFLIEKRERVVVGSFIFKGEPDANGEIEIGYGTEPPFQGKGYMSEAVTGVLMWAATQPRLTAIIAETEQTNLSSIRVLEKTGFVRSLEQGGMQWWRKPLSPVPLL